MKEVFKRMSEVDMKALVKWMKQIDASASVLAPVTQQQSLKLDTYLSLPPVSRIQPQQPLMMQSGLAISKPSYSETRKCYNCGVIGHLSRVCPKNSRERGANGRGQLSDRELDCGGQRGGRGSSSEGYRANLTVIEEKEKNVLTFTEEDRELLELLRRKKLACNDGKKSITEEVFTPISSRGDFTTYARSSTDTHAHALASIPTIRASEWIVDSGAS